MRMTLHAPHGLLTLQEHGYETAQLRASLSVRLFVGYNVDVMPPSD